MSQVIEKLQENVASTGAVVANLESLRGRRHRRRKIAWVGFILLGMMVGTVWSLGFATATTGAGAETAAAAIVGGTGATSTNTWSGQITMPENIAFGFTGTWGKFDQDYTVYKVDLNEAATSTGQYFMTIALNQAPVGFTAVQLKWAIKTFDAGGSDSATVTTTCAGSTNFSDASSNQVMAIQDEDAQAVFSGLSGGSEYCIGIADITKANETSGHFVRRPSAGALPGTFPTFLGILNRSS